MIFRAGIARFAIVYLVLMALLATACQKVEGVKLAEVDGQVIVASELQKYAGRELSERRENLYKVEKQKLEEYINAVLLTQEAKKRGISVEAVLDEEVNSKILPIGDDEINAFYKLNKQRIAMGLEHARELIRDYLRNQKTEAQKVIFFKSLRAEAKVVTYLKPPLPFRAELSVHGEPFKGSEHARVTIVKFEDFQCPFCKRAQTTINELFLRYKDKVKLVHKDFPLENLHPQARDAAEAARCANEQGKFWEYHDTLYANAPQASRDNLKRYAKEVSLNIDSFDRCLASEKYKAVVQRDLKEGTQLGLTGTPTFFINGREFTGAPSLENFSAMVDEELAAAK